MSLESAPSSLMHKADGVVFALLLIAGVAAMWPHLHRSAFYDEAWIIEAATQPTTSDGWAILLHDKSPASAGYIAMLHAITQVASPSVYLFRVVHAMVGIVVVLLAMRLAYAWSGSSLLTIAAAAALLLMPMYQRYATEAKQYVLESALALGMIIAVQVWTCGVSSERKRAAWCWFALALIAITSTFSGWFSAAATGLVAGLFILKSRDTSNLKRAIIFAIALAAVAAVMHTQFNKHIAGSSTLEGYWAEYYLPLNANWPAKTFESLTALFNNCWFRYERFPGSAMVILCLIGFAAWIRRQPASGLAALAIVLVTLAASTAKLWPLNLRVNLHMLVVLHLAAAAGPIILGSWLWSKFKPAQSPALLPWLALAPALFFIAVIWRESGSGNYEIAAVDKLLDETAKVATTQDIVVLMPAARINQEIAPRAIAGTVRGGPWVTQGRITRELMPLMALATQRPVVFAVSHHHGAVVEAFAELNQALLPYGRLTRTWSDRFVAIYRYEPTGSHTEHD